MSANTTLAPVISTTFAQATNVQAGIITSSFGFNPKDNKILIKPLVHELLKIANFLLNLFLKDFQLFHKLAQMLSKDWKLSL